MRPSNETQTIQKKGHSELCDANNTLLSITLNFRWLATAQRIRLLSCCHFFFYGYTGTPPILFTSHTTAESSKQNITIFKLEIKQKTQRVTHKTIISWFCVVSEQ